MASPQLENGYISIATEIWEALTAYRIAGEQMQCLMFIIRKTYGWKKTTSRIPLDEFMEATGIKKQNIVRAINGLLSKKIINVIKKDNERGSTPIKEKEKKEISIYSPVASKNGIPYEEIISYLNEKANTHYRHNTKATQQKIKARWNEGFRLDDFMKAIDSRVAKWLKDPDMSEYLRPDTIFNSNKFEGYVNAPITKPKDDLSEWEMK